MTVRVLDTQTGEYTPGKTSEGFARIRVRARNSLLGSGLGLRLGLGLGLDLGLV